MPTTVQSPQPRAAVTVAGDRPPLRVRPAPAFEPPFDDQCERPPAGMDPLPLPGPLFANPPASGRRPADGRPTARPGTGRGREQPPAAGARPGTARRPGQIAARRFVELCVEVLNGFRPVTQLRALTRPQRFELVTGQLVHRTGRLRMSRGEGQRPVRLRKIRICEPAPGAAEAAAVLEQGDRTWAMAVRMERDATGWQCSVVQVV